MVNCDCQWVGQCMVSELTVNGQCMVSEWSVSDSWVISWWSVGGQPRGGLHSLSAHALIGIICLDMGLIVSYSGGAKIGLGCATWYAL